MRNRFTYDDETEDVPKDVTHVDFDPSIDVVPMRAFQQCQKLVDVSFPHDLKRLERQAFQHCISLQELELPPPTMKIGIRCFDGCRKLVMADLSNCRVWVLMTQCFRNCTSLEFVHLPSNLEVIARDAFRGCQSLKEISLEPTQLKVFGKRALSDCRSLQKVRIPPSTEQVGSWAFVGCTSLTEVQAPITLSLSRQDVFKNCPKLQRITFYSDRDSAVNRRSEPLPARPDTNRRVHAPTEDAVQQPSVSAREQVTSFTQALHEAKQENAVLSQRLKDVCEKLERYESQWTTIADQLKSSTMENTNTRQNGQAQALQAKEKELENYKDIVERQRKEILAMKMSFLELPESAERSGTEQQGRTCAEQSGGNITKVPFRAALKPDTSLADFVTMQREQSRLPTPNFSFGASMEQTRVDDVPTVKPVPFVIDQDNLSVDTADFLVTQTQLSQGSDEWQVM